MRLSGQNISRSAVLTSPCKPPDLGGLPPKFGRQIAFLVDPVPDDTHLCRRERSEKRPCLLWRACQPNFVVRRVEDHRHPSFRMDRPYQIIRRCCHHRMPQACFALPAQFFTLDAPKSGYRKDWSRIRVIRRHAEPEILSRFFPFRLVEARCWNQTTAVQKLSFHSPAAFPKMLSSLALFQARGLIGDPSRLEKFGVKNPQFISTSSRPTFSTCRTIGAG
jgi:hypothetical protein